MRKATDEEADEEEEDDRDIGQRRGAERGRYLNRCTIRQRTVRGGVSTFFADSLFHCAVACVLCCSLCFSVSSLCLRLFADPRTLLCPPVSQSS